VWAQSLQVQKQLQARVVRLLLLLLQMPPAQVLLAREPQQMQVLLMQVQVRRALLV
jgi:hypothetical protein